MTRLYICGAITADPDNYERNFATADNALNAAAEETWFAQLDDAMQDYLQLLYARYIEAPKAEREILEVRVHEAKRDVIDRFSKGVGA